MRAFLALSVAILLAIAPRAEAARRSDTSGGAASGRPALARPAVSAAKPAASRPAAPASRAEAARSGRTIRGHARAAASRGVASADSRYASAHRLCPRGGAPGRGGRCRDAGAAEYGGGAARGLRWQAGLPPAGHTQRECPDGTLATLARGHDDVVRCVPL
ncbi:hypothetical protein [Caldovatus aquaticus]|uniref:Uncharacterized protein n=1 Tax=Caldovatus aquaticus TaxID=2865671 RepID=A0ABS7F6G7_9PROT|nr:hypothetical protein [Caldovatus aquaticus]MBW8271217.1 hypothetical protein [Caldovatus aquaticus]